MDVRKIYKLAYVLWRKGENKKALKCINRVLKFEKKNEEVFYAKGRILMDLGRCEEAFKCFCAAIRIKDFAEFYISAGESLVGLGKFEEAMNYFNKGLETEPKNDFALFNKGMCLSKLGKIKEALNIFNKISRKFKLNDSVLIMKAHCLTKLGKLSEAYECVKKAAQKNPYWKGLKRERREPHAIELIEGRISFIGKVEFKFLIPALGRKPKVTIPQKKFEEISKGMEEYFGTDLPLFKSVDEAEKKMHEFHEWYLKKKEKGLRYGVFEVVEVDEDIVVITDVETRRVYFVKENATPNFCVGDVIETAISYMDGLYRFCHPTIKVFSCMEREMHKNLLLMHHS